MPKASIPTEERFWIYTEKTDTCWNWTGGKSEGYGMIKLSGTRKMRGAHRFSYELHYGPIPDGMVIDHICRNRSCVNPGHLQAVSNQHNAENLDVTPESNRTGHLNVYKRNNAYGYMVIVRSGGKRHYGGAHATVEEAAEAARLLRIKLKTNNLQDRPAA
jgi:hypothetical protein